MSPTTYELFAVKYAHHERPAADTFVFRDDVNDGPGPLDYFVWVARSAERTFVIDTGFSEATGARRSRTILRNPKEGLAALGIDASDRATSKKLSTCARRPAGNGARPTPSAATAARPAASSWSCAWRRGFSTTSG
jgi:hypothetical protein